MCAANTSRFFPLASFHRCFAPPGAGQHPSSFRPSTQALEQPDQDDKHGLHLSTTSISPPPPPAHSPSMEQPDRGAQATTPPGPSLLSSPDIAHASNASYLLGRLAVQDLAPPGSAWTRGAGASAKVRKKRKIGVGELVRNINRAFTTMNFTSLCFCGSLCLPWGPMRWAHCWSAQQPCDRAP